MISVSVAVRSGSWLLPCATLIVTGGACGGAVNPLDLGMLLDTGLPSPADAGPGIVMDGGPLPPCEPCPAGECPPIPKNGGQPVDIATVAQPCSGVVGMAVDGCCVFFSVYQGEHLGCTGLWKAAK